MGRPGSGGVTLIELLVTVTVLAIVLGLGVPSFSRLIASNRIASQTNEFTGALQLARSEAVRRGLGVALRTDNSTDNFAAEWKVFTNSDNSGSASSYVTTVTDQGMLIREGGAGNTSTAGTTATIKRVTRSGSVGAYTYATSTAADRVFLVFNSRGATLAGGAAFFKVCDAATTSVKGRIVQVSTVGKVSLDSSNESC